MRTKLRSSCIGILVVILASSGGPVRAGKTAAACFERSLALPLPPGYAEVVVAPNPVEAALALGTWRAPVEGERVLFPGGDAQAWRAIAADEHGWFTDSVLAKCYLSISFEAAERCVMILQAMGDEMAYVNGALRSGNPYCLKDERESWEPDFDISYLPVELEKGTNDLLFRCGRGRFKARLYEPAKPVFLNAHDVTAPDIVVGRETGAWGAIVVVNATRKPLRGLAIRARLAGEEAVSAPVPLIQPCSVRKVGFRLAAGPRPERGEARAALELVGGLRGEDAVLDTASVALRVVGEGENRRETFLSAIDGSVQYYGINPAFGAPPGEPRALFLSLHGASVEAVNQSGSYQSKTWGHIVAPTNRRPYGFNWEEWGRLDALEVIDVVRSRYAIDTTRIYLTGHSMGGHGVWHLGTLFPDRFAAAGPSAGWISFWTYRFKGIDLGDTTAVRRMIRRATNPSETFRHAANLEQLGVYVLHGADDDNVPVSEARSMVDSLGAFHRDLVYHEQPGVGHWWDLSGEPGVDCVDWAPMFDFFARHARGSADRIRDVSFATSNPGVSARDLWLTIDAQERELCTSSARVHVDPGDAGTSAPGRFVGSTENVARLALDADVLRNPGPVTVELDGQRLEAVPRPAAGGRLWLEKRGGLWRAAVEPSSDFKGARRYGTFKEAFRNRPVFVFGTKGTRAENEWAFAKARYDAEKLWYQGNGSIDVVADVDFDPAAELDRNVILYGNGRTNAVWKPLLGTSPVQVGASEARVGERRFAGKDLCCICVRPRPGSATASVGAVSGTGLVGMRLANRLPYLNPGINLPDCTVLAPAVLTDGDAGVLLTGFFGLDWGASSGEWVRGGR